MLVLDALVSAWMARYSSFRSPGAADDDVAHEGLLSTIDTRSWNCPGIFRWHRRRAWQHGFSGYSRFRRKRCNACDLGFCEATFGRVTALALAREADRLVKASAGAAPNGQFRTLNGQGHAVVPVACAPVLGLGTEGAFL